MPNSEMNAAGSRCVSVSAMAQCQAPCHPGVWHRGTAADADEDECHRLEPLAGPYLLISPARVKGQGTPALHWETAWRHSALTMPPGCVIKTLPTAESGYRSWKKV
ncbi:hypothetical protein AOLI_G00018890 [Acnodon oligacanthus]